MNAQKVLNILNCLKEILDLHEYKVLILCSYNERNTGFCVNTCDKTIEFTILEEE